MLLRSSSAPFLTPHISEGDHHDCSPLTNKPFHRTSLINTTACRGLSLKPLPSMRRARSEADLQSFVSPSSSSSSSSDAEDRKAHETTMMNHPESHSCSQLSIIQEKGQDQFSEERAVQFEEDLNMSSDGYSAMVFEDGKHVSKCASPPCTHDLPLVREGQSLNPLLMASGLGISSKAEDFVANVGSGGGRGCDDGRGSFGGRGRPSSSPHGDSTDLYYQQLLQSDPQNPLFLRNYAQYLSEAKHDYKKSEEYYERAILACPNDGEVLSKYAKHVWDVHKNSERAGSYFDQAVKATPDDCYVLASYASFLWQSEDGDEDNDEALESECPPLHGTGAPPLLMASA